MTARVSPQAPPSPPHQSKSSGNPSPILCNHYQSAQRQRTAYFITKTQGRAHMAWLASTGTYVPVVATHTQCQAAPISPPARHEPPASVFNIIIHTHLPVSH